MLRAVLKSVQSFSIKKNAKGLPAATRRVLTAVCLLTVPTTVIATWLTQEEPFAFLVGRKTPKIGEMITDVPGNSDPTLVNANDADLADDDLVIGVVAFGEAKAYLREALDGRPANHVVHDRFGATQVTVTYCGRTGCTRVFSATGEKNLHDLHCGGWMAQQEMALLVGAKRFPQSSQEIPFDDVPFIVTTWGEWRMEYPESAVYLGRRDFIRSPKAKPDPGVS
jgi:hypothetical protein